MKPVSVAAMQEIDARSEKAFGVSSLTLMENAGRAVAAQTQRFVEDRLKKTLKTAKLVVCCGRGNNGGDGIAAARALKTMGADIRVFCLAPGDKPLKKELVTQIEHTGKEGLTCEPADTDAIDTAIADCDLAIDAVLGTGAKGKPMGPAHHLIQKLARSKKPILALDNPSGIDADTGYHTGVFVEATVTVTLGLPKEGLLKPHAKRFVGELIVVDIGHPKELLAPYL
ncbi:MAG: NAD(P)H-hydrate epimerase [Elusimicrobiota bacterium]